MLRKCEKHFFFNKKNFFLELLLPLLLQLKKL